MTLKPRHYSATEWARKVALFDGDEQAALRFVEQGEREGREIDRMTRRDQAALRAEEREAERARKMRRD